MPLNVRSPAPEAGAPSRSVAVVIVGECSRATLPGGPGGLRQKGVRYDAAHAQPSVLRRMNAAPLRVGLLGAGNVGREVVRVLLDQPDSLRTVEGVALELASVAVRDVVA